MTDKPAVSRRTALRLALASARYKDLYRTGMTLQQVFTATSATVSPATQVRLSFPPGVFMFSDFTQNKMYGTRIPINVGIANSGRDGANATVLRMAPFSSTKGPQIHQNPTWDLSSASPSGKLVFLHGPPRDSCRRCRDQRTDGNRRERGVDHGSGAGGRQLNWDRLASANDDGRLLPPDPKVATDVPEVGQQLAQGHRDHRAEDGAGRSDRRDQDPGQT